MKKLSKVPFQVDTSKGEEGFVLLFTVIVVGSIVLTSVLVLFGLTFSSIRLNKLQKDQAGAKYLAEACVEYSLELVRSDLGYTGSGSQSLGNGNFDYQVFDVASNKRIECAGIAGGSSKNILVETSELSPLIQIDSWREVQSF